MTTAPKPAPIIPQRPKSLQRNIMWIFATGVSTVISLFVVSFCWSSAFHSYGNDMNLVGMAPHIIAQDSNSGGGPLPTPAGYPSYPAYPITRRFMAYHYPHHWHYREMRVERYQL